MKGPPDSIGGPHLLSTFPFQGLFRLYEPTGDLLPCSMLGTRFLCDVTLLIKTVYIYYGIASVTFLPYFFTAYSVALPDLTIIPTAE